jgi:NADH-quinone oxidoreductase subunit L
MIYKLIVFLPLLGAVIAGFGGRALGVRPVMVIATGLLFVSAGLSWIDFLGPPGGIAHAASGDGSAVQAVPTLHVVLAQWIASGVPNAQDAFMVDWSLRIDTLTRVMLVVVTTVSALVHLYSFGYMAEDGAKDRFFAFLSFFTFAMVMLVTADNFLQLFFGWEGVGLASYLLIGFWWKKPSANAAAIKAFVVNRVGDFGFALGIAGIFLAYGSVDFDTVFAMTPDKAGETFNFLGMQLDIVTTVTFLLFIGAMGKSAQLFLHTWLPDAMEGPTPVSALIHAATMVTAGVFLVCRCSPMFEYAPFTQQFVIIIGATTCFFAATIGLVQHDIKRVIAYSTCSQLGYMFFAAGVGAYEAAMFHLFTHAFFKALLFLGAGSVIHAMHHEQDMRNYGGLLRKTPRTALVMLIGTLAITGAAIPGVIGFAGYYSKDIIIEAAFASPRDWHEYAFWMGVIAAVMTSFYSWRLWFKTFLTQPRGDMHAHAHAHESPLIMLIPLYVLALGAVVAGFMFYGDFVGHNAAAFWGSSIHHSADNHVLHDAHAVPIWVKRAPFFAMLLGLGGAVVFYLWITGIPDALARRHKVGHDFLLNKWYFDEIYHFIFVKPALWLGKTLWQKGDGTVIDGVIDGIAFKVTPALTGFVQRVQSGYLARYASVMILGILVMISWIVFGGY